VLWSLAFALLGIFEEFLYRGYVLHTLSIGLGFWPAACLLAVLFGGLHITNAGESVIGALNGVLWALFASFTLKQTGNLWFAAGMHSTWNFSLTFLYSVPGSGLVAKGHLLHSHLDGPAWLTGGGAGPEGSVLAFVGLGASFVLFARPGPSRLIG
jgi:membrane protease YdiL (CAAX protease family)